MKVDPKPPMSFEEWVAYAENPPADAHQLPQTILDRWNMEMGIFEPEAIARVEAIRAEIEARYKPK